MWPSLPATAHWQPSATSAAHERRLGGSSFWDVRRRSVTNSFTGRTPLCTSQDGRWLACQGIEDGTIQFRDLDTGRTWTSQGGFEASPDKNQFAFSPDGRWLASTGFELVLWETAPDGRFSTRWEIRELLTLAEGSEAILDLQFCRTSEGEILGSSDAGGACACGGRTQRHERAPHHTPSKCNRIVFE